MAIEIQMPDIGEEKLEVVEILVKVGDKIEVDQSLLTVEGNKTSIEIPALHAGIVKEINVSIGDRVETGSVVMILDSCNEERVIEYTHNQREQKDTSQIKKHKIPYDESIKNDIYVHASPLVRRLARKFNIKLSEIKGTGHKGRILYEDIQGFLQKKDGYDEISSIRTSSGSFPDVVLYSKEYFEKFGEVEEVELSKIQKVSSAHLKCSWVTIPHVTIFDKTDITDLEAFRKQQNSEAEKSNLYLKTTLLVFVMKIVASVLKQMPRFNSSLSDNGQNLILKKYINIGIAVDTAHGLLVPVIKDVNKKNISELSSELIIISKKAREGKLTPNEMQGSCFTISSIGKLGTTYFSPIINAPEVAILGISKTSIEPIWDGEKFIPRLMLPLSLSFDHRVIDGADGARFMGIVKNKLSDIRLLMM